MKVLTVNTGSSSVRLALFSTKGADLQPVAPVHLHTAEQDPEPLLQAFLKDCNVPEVNVISHRVVHGGMRFKASCLLDAEAEKEIDHLSYLAPLHNPRALQWIEGCRHVLGENVPQVAVFDTAFYADLPLVAATYALPKEICERNGVRRFGFHGLAHQAMGQRWRQLKPELEEGGRFISLQLGSGCSITAVNCGRPQDTSMGFSPVEGLVMSTRCGDIDAGLLTYLQRTENLTADELEYLLNHCSGLRGISGMSEDMRELLRSDAPAAKLAINLFCYRARKYIGAYLAVLEGADAILFGGGVGENAAPIREQILSPMKWCGIHLDVKANSATTGREACISLPESKVEVWVVPTDEATILAREAVAIVGR